MLCCKNKISTEMVLYASAIQLYTSCFGFLKQGRRLTLFKETPLM